MAVVSWASARERSRVMWRVTAVYGVGGLEIGQMEMVSSWMLGSRVPSDILRNPHYSQNSSVFSHIPHSTTQPNSPCVSLNAWHIRSAPAQLTNLPYSRDASAGSYTENPFWRHIKDIRIRTCSENWNSIIRHWSEMCARGSIHSRNRVSFHSHSYYVSRDSLTLKKNCISGRHWLRK